MAICHGTYTPDLTQEVLPPGREVPDPIRRICASQRPAKLLAAIAAIEQRQMVRQQRLCSALQQGGC
jgi:hypothetical protein